MIKPIERRSIHREETNGFFALKNSGKSVKMRADGPGAQRNAACVVIEKIRGKVERRKGRRITHSILLSSLSLSLALDTRPHLTIIQISRTIIQMSEKRCCCRSRASEIICLIIPQNAGASSKTCPYSTRETQRSARAFCVFLDANFVGCTRKRETV